MNLLKALNPEQKKAVTHDKGPLLIIAGAGTGKTRVITSRILHLILEKKAPPGEILALTFTEKAAEEMLSRVDLAMPLGYEEIYIKTFHGFCDHILRERGLEIGLNTGYRLLTEAEAWLLVKKNLFRFDLDYYRPLGNPSRFISALIKHFSRLKDEDITPEKYMEYVNTMCVRAHPPAGRAGCNAPLQRTDNDTNDDQQKFKEIANAYKTYQDLLIENDNLDFGDLHFYVLRLFEKRKNVLKEYQNRFKYILVDEFQDTNYAQTKLIEMLASSHRNIMVVGDDDQGIYRFRGASVNNILQFEKLFPKTKKVVLTKNYRSHQNILDLSYKVIQNNNPDRLESKEKISKKLKSQEAGKMESTNIVFKEFNNYLEEVNFVVDEIEKQKEKDIAILVRANAHADPFIAELTLREIPFQYISQKSIWQREEIKDLTALLRFLANQRDDLALFRVLTFKIFDLQMENILELVNKARSLHTPLFQVLKKEKEPDLFQDNEKNQKVVNLLGKLIEFSKSKSVSLVLGKFLYEETDYIKALEQDYEKIQGISEFSKIVNSFEVSSKNNRVIDFVDYIDLMEEVGDNPRLSQEAFEEGGVKVMTVHSAKGLEFDTVFLVNLVDQRFPTTSRKDPIEIPEKLIPENLPGGDFHIREERRLFYVACTRAKKRLYLTCSKYYEGKKKWKRSVFIEEAMGSGMIDDSSVETRRLLVSTSLKNDNVGVHCNAPLQQGINTIRFPIPNKLSYSQIDTFSICPYKYRFRYLFNLPSPTPHAANFGSSVHNTLKEFYQVLRDGGEVDKDLLKKLYEENWIPFGYESKAHENARKKKGFEILEWFYESNCDPWVIPAFLERGFNLRVSDGIISGRIDRIDKLSDGSFEVIDYKTGRLKKGTNLKKDLQLSIYALACRDILKLPASKLSLYYLENNEKVSTERSDGDLEVTKEKIAEIVKTMRSSDFCATPGFMCSFCEYKKICDFAV